MMYLRDDWWAAVLAHPEPLPFSLDYPILFLVVGALLLLLGRRLFWLFIAAAGFVTGMELARLVFPHQPELLVLAIALLLGLLGAVLAIFVQKLAIGVAGFLAGGYLAATLYPSLFGISGPHAAGTWLLFLIGGIIGAIVMAAFFNWALIILSSLQGAHFILKGLGVRPLALGAHRRYSDAGHSLAKALNDHHGYGLILFILLAVLGMAVQAGTYRRVPPRED